MSFIEEGFIENIISTVWSVCYRRFYFTQYKGNLVSLAIAEAVLHVVEEEGLVAHAQELGSYIVSQLRLLANKHTCIGDVRYVCNVCTFHAVIQAGNLRVVHKPMKFCGWIKFVVYSVIVP